MQTSVFYQRDIAIIIRLALFSQLTITKQTQGRSDIAGRNVARSYRALLVWHLTLSLQKKKKKLQKEKRTETQRKLTEIKIIF